MLGSDQTVRSLQASLEGAIGYRSSDTSVGPGAIQSLSDIGITVNDDGSLSLDISKLASVMANPASVQNFFQGSALNGFAQQFSSESWPALMIRRLARFQKEIQNLNQSQRANSILLPIT